MCSWWLTFLLSLRPRTRNAQPKSPWNGPNGITARRTWTFLSIDFQTDPNRFWLIELMAEGMRVYAVALPDSKVVEPVCRKQL